MKQYGYMTITFSSNEDQKQADVIKKHLKSHKRVVSKWAREAIFEKAIREGILKDDDDGEGDSEAAAAVRDAASAFSGVSNVAGSDHGGDETAVS